MLTDTQIKELSKRMSIPLAGVYFKDELPNKIKPNMTYIINLEDSVDNEGNENEGTHWTMAQMQELPNGDKAPIYFDPYGKPPPERVKKVFCEASGFKSLPYTEKDIQSLMNNACGWYCLALAHYINAYPGRDGKIYNDVNEFMECFDDLNKSVDFKKNEFILKHFFQSADPAKRKAIDVIKPVSSISSEDEPGGINAFERHGHTPLEVAIKYMNEKN